MSQEEIQEQRPLITLEDEIVCEGCIKRDVCEIFMSVVRLGSYAQNLENDFSVKVNLSASIYECGHRKGNEIEISENL